MRRSLFICLAFLLAISKSAVAYDNFKFNPSTTKTAIAGTAFNTDIRSIEGTGHDTSFFGTVNISAIHQTLGPVAIVPGTADLVSGTANVNITLNIAGGVDIIVADAILTSISSWAGHATIGADSVDHFIMLLQQGSSVMQVQVPGSVNPGYTPIWVTVTAAGAPCAVSIVAVDQFNNTTPIGATITVQDNFSSPIYFDQQHQVNGIAAFDDWTPNPPDAQIGTFILTAAAPYNIYPMAEGKMSIAVPTTYYIHFDSFTTVYAGVPFSVTAKASDLPSVYNPQPSASLYQILLSPLLINSSPGTGTLTPSTATLGADGTTNTMYTYNVAETIFLDPSIIQPIGERAIERGISPLITVLPGAPAQLVASVSPSSVQASHTAVISVTVMDAYQNVIPNVPVSFTILDTISGATLNTPTAQSDASGVAQVTFIGGILNETVIVECKVNTLVETVSVNVSVAPPGGNVMINYPNPFNPTVNNQKTSINYYLTSESTVEIRIYNAFGRTVLSKDISPGQGTGDFAYATIAGGAYFYWDGKNGEGRLVGNGIYLLKVKASNSGGTQEFKRRVGVVK